MSWGPPPPKPENGTPRRSRDSVLSQSDSRLFTDNHGYVMSRKLQNRNSQTSMKSDVFPMTESMTAYQYDQYARRQQHDKDQQKDLQQQENDKENIDSDNRSRRTSGIRGNQGQLTDSGKQKSHDFDEEIESSRNTPTGSSSRQTGLRGDTQSLSKSDNGPNNKSYDFDKSVDFENEIESTRATPNRNTQRQTGERSYALNSTNQNESNDLLTQMRDNKIYNPSVRQKQSDSPRFYTTQKNDTLKSGPSELKRYNSIRSGAHSSLTNDLLDSKPPSRTAKHRIAKKDSRVAQVHEHKPKVDKMVMRKEQLFNDFLHVDLMFLHIIKEADILTEIEASKVQTKILHEDRVQLLCEMMQSVKNPIDIFRKFGNALYDIEPIAADYVLLDIASTEDQLELDPFVYSDAKTSVHARFGTGRKLSENDKKLVTKLISIRTQIERTVWTRELRRRQDYLLQERWIGRQLDELMEKIYLQLERGCSGKPIEDEGFSDEIPEYLTHRTYTNFDRGVELQIKEDEAHRDSERARLVDTKCDELFDLANAALIDSETMTAIRDQLKLAIEQLGMSYSRHIVSDYEIKRAIERMLQEIEMEKQSARELDEDIAALQAQYDKLLIESREKPISIFKIVVMAHKRATSTYEDLLERDDEYLRLKKELKQTKQELEKAALRYHFLEVGPRLITICKKQKDKKLEEMEEDEREEEEERDQEILEERRAYQIQTEPDIDEEFLEEIETARGCANLKHSQMKYKAIKELMAEVELM